MDEPGKPKEVSEKVIEEIPKKQKEKPKRGSSVAGMKTMTSSSNLYKTAS